MTCWNPPNVTAGCSNEFKPSAHSSTSVKVSEALDDCGFNFPDAELVEDLLIYSTLPGFDTRLYTIAKQWLEQGIERIKTQCKVLNFALLIAIIALLCGIALAVSSLQQQLGHSMTL